MLGTRFYLAETLVEIARREPDAADEAISDDDRDAVLGDHCAELERQMAEVARQLHGAHPRTSVRCPICDSRMRLHADRIVSEFAAYGVETHGLECGTCGLTTERAYHVAHGYRDDLR